MSKKIFINNLNTYVSEEIFNVFHDKPEGDDGGDDDANLIFGTYLNKDSSQKPPGVKKMLKVPLFVISRYHIFRDLNHVLLASTFPIAI